MSIPAQFAARRDGTYVRQQDVDAAGAALGAPVVAVPDPDPG